MDILAKVLDVTDYGDLRAVAAAVVPSAAKEEVELWIDARLDPRRYLRKLTRHSDELIDCMRETGAVLSGSRAAAYFYPNLSTESSDWDFYVCLDLRNAVTFLNFLVGLGAKLVGTSSLIDKSEESEPIYGECRIAHIWSLELGEKSVQKVQVIFYPATSILPLILSFDLSCVQCIITGSNAISLYHYVTKAGVCIKWKGENDITVAHTSRVPEINSGPQKLSPVQDSFIKAIDEVSSALETAELGSKASMKTLLKQRVLKYTERGMKVVSPSAKQAVLEYNPYISGSNHLKCRYVGDRGCATVRFGIYGYPYTYSEECHKFMVWTQNEKPRLIDDPLMYRETVWGTCGIKDVDRVYKEEWFIKLIKFLATTSCNHQASLCNDCCDMLISSASIKCLRSVWSF